MVVTFSKGGIDWSATVGYASLEKCKRGRSCSSHNAQVFFQIRDTYSTFVCVRSFLVLHIDNGIAALWVRQHTHHDVTEAMGSSKRTSPASGQPWTHQPRGETSANSIHQGVGRFAQSSSRSEHASHPKGPCLGYDLLLAHGPGDLSSVS